ncbi:ABC transporter ATP-binding protein [Actinomyces weissii]|uniref:ABC transporter ATP-binding protein n=1 Tax=Actinomyces weissii TaxID=675090 RepID=A0A7T7MA12_9ACTO|nr:ABC transporter ATP-binding protein [Actinomyces weissii]QQM67612.1 ABC transporter ATP-binding protein [Actinomyces weissii]
MDHLSPEAVPASRPQGLRAHTPAADAVVTAQALTKVYGRGDNAVKALDQVDVSLGRGRFTAIMGPSGSGKSTLMHCLAGLERATSGTIDLDGELVSSMSQRRLTRLRRERIGFVFQAFNLVPSLSAEENITLPLDIAHRKVDRAHFNRVVDAVGLRDRLTHRPAELSGGQVQRVACARALVGRPAVVFADEPTGNLDSQATRQVLTILRESVDEMGQSVVMVTHEPEAAAWADTVLFLRDGKVVAQMDDPDQERVLDALRELAQPLDPASEQPLASETRSQS